MGAPLRAEDVLQREVEKMEVRAERLRSELAVEENQERLRAALSTLRNGVPEALAR